MAAKPLSKKHMAFIDEYLQTFNGTRAYMAIYPKATYESAMALSAKLLGDIRIKAVLEERMKAAHMGADEALALLAEQGRADIGVFFKIVDEWMFNPLPSYEILDEKEVVDDTKDPPEKHVSYRVRHVALDMDKVVDPRYSHLIREFSDSPKNGLGIKLHDKQAAYDKMLKVHGKIVEKRDDKIELVVRYATDDKPAPATPEAG